MEVEIENKIQYLIDKFQLSEEQLDKLDEMNQSQLDTSISDRFNVSAYGGGGPDESLD